MNATVIEPPLASEQALLGGCILDPDRITEAAGIVSAEDFYRPEHGRLWMLLRDMRAAGDVVDLVTVTEAVLRGGHADQYGGLTYVLSLTERVSSTVNLPHYARLVADGHQRRRLTREADAIAQAAREGAPLTALRARLAMLAALDGADGEQEWTTYADAAERALAAMDAVQNAGGSTGAPVPWAALMTLVHALPRGQVTVLGARPSHGKSALARNFAECCAESGDAVLVFSLEMSDTQIASMTLCSYAGVPLSDAMRGRLDQRAWTALEATRPGVADLPIYVSTAPDVTADDVVSRTQAMARRLERRGQRIGLVVIDYLQLLRKDRGADGRNDSAIIGEQTRALKVLAVALDIPVLLLSQLNRKATDADGRDAEPNTAHLRDSGSIEADAAIILLLHRPHRGSQDTPDTKAMVRVAKNRFGALGDVFLRWDGPAVTFRDEDWTAMQRMVD